MKKYKILILLGDLNRCNGISSYVMNYYKKIDKEKFKIDFIITNDDVDLDYKKIIKENNSKIYFIKAPKIKTMFRDLNNIKSFLKENLNKYDIFYCHLVNQGYFYLRYAKKLGFKKTIFHSHNIVTREKNILRDFRNQLFKNLISKSANYYFACSDMAGQDVLGKNGNYTIINNAIEINNYAFSKNARKELRNQLNINDGQIVFIQVGRLAYQKNPEFTIELFNKLNKEFDDSLLLFVGFGPDEEKLKNMVNGYMLSDKIKFLGVRDDVEKLMSASDIFLFPSRFEGLGMVAIEAQISGLPCYISDKVPTETKIMDTTKYISLDDIELWTKNIVLDKNDFCNRRSYIEEAKSKGYDINTEVKKLEKVLEEIASK